ncbi:MAG: TetR/AcrR family transcriptional regulator [Gammaproteobacteria bacterium]|nr:MAG: TetR/AcrR family transcriptional regulator [Gammaproteobacteria bacterium]
MRNQTKANRTKAATRTTPRKAAASAAKRAPRRTQAERTAETRRKLIEAAVSILFESGYAAASTTAVADRAGVSRGSIFHNFPTKVDLMIAVLDYVLEEDLKFYNERLKDLPSRRDYPLVMTRISWEAFSGPRGIAVTQIILAGASDPDLKARLPTSLLRISDRSVESQPQRVPVGPAMQKLRTVSSRVHVAALRGLAMDVIAGVRDRDVEDELALLERYMQFVVDVLAPEAAAKDREAREATPARP